MSGLLVWITGLSGAGKTTIANALYKKIIKHHSNTLLLDGDSFRYILGGNSGYTKEERFEVGFKIARMCNFLISQNMNVICATISLFKEIHYFNRSNIKNYFEVFVDVDMKELIKRDSKGLYNGALKGDIKNVVGVDIAYDRPKDSDLILHNSSNVSVETQVDKILYLIDL